MKALPAGLVACGIAGALLLASAAPAYATLDMQKKAKAAAKATDGYVHENPWKSISIAAGPTKNNAKIGA